MSVPVENPARGRPRDPRRREAILAAAIALVGEVGYDRVTVDALAARAGVSKPTIYRRWPGGKQEIIVEAIRAKHADAGELPDTGSLRGDLLAMLAPVIAGIEQEAHLAGGLITQLRSSHELQELFRDEVIAHERSRYDVLLARARDRGEIAGPVTPLFADVAGSVIFSRAILAGEPVDTAFLQQLIDTVLLPIVSRPAPQGPE
jgi:AcrR family transcriptional regulator